MGWRQRLQERFMDFECGATFFAFTFNIDDGDAFIAVVVVVVVTAGPAVAEIVVDVSCWDIVTVTADVVVVADSIVLVLRLVGGLLAIAGNIGSLKLSGEVVVLVLLLLLLLLLVFVGGEFKLSFISRPPTNLCS